MKQSIILTLCLIILTLSGTQAIPLSRTTRCTCISISDQPIYPKTLEKLEVIPASEACPDLEIIVTMKKSGERKCLNPESKAAKNLMKLLSKKRSAGSKRI